MNLDGRRESSNVEDRRGMSGGKKAGMGAGILGVIIAMAVAYFSGGDPLSAGMQAFQENGGLGSLTGTNTEVSEEQREFTEEEQELARFSTQILAGTEDVWKEIFEENDMEYEVPTMVLYTDGTQTACGQGSAQMGPFYCSGDQKLYIDLSFFTEMKSKLGADGDRYAWNCWPTSMQESGRTTTTRCSALWRMATSRRPSTVLRSSVTTTCRRRPEAMPCRSRSTTAPPSSA